MLPTDYGGEQSIAPIDLTSKEFQDAVKKIQESLRNRASARRRKKTPDSAKKYREIDNKGTTAAYVDRADYQRAIDNDFPGWSIREIKCWTDTRSDGIPVLFHVQVMVEVVDGTIKRTMPGIGTATVSLKSTEKGHTQDMKFSYKSALTDAIKCAAEWLGEFYDLRADEEKRVEDEKPLHQKHIDTFHEMLSKVQNQNARTELIRRFSKQRRSSVLEFLSNMAQKLEIKLTEEGEIINDTGETESAETGAAGTTEALRDRDTAQTE